MKTKELNQQEKKELIKRLKDYEKNIKARLNNCHTMKDIRSFVIKLDSKTLKDMIMAFRAFQKYCDLTMRDLLILQIMESVL